MSVVLIAALAFAQAPVYVPSETRVLVVPPMNTSGDKYEEMKQNQIDEARKTLRSRFAERGFQLVSEEESAQIFKDSGVDFADEENWRKEPLYKMGEAAHARLVVFTVIERTYQKKTERLLGESLEGYAALKTWLLDVQDKKPILSAAKFEAKSSRNANTGSLKQIRAVRLGLDEQLKEFLKPYPTLKR